MVFFISMLTEYLLRSKWLALQFSSFFAYSAPLRGYSIVFYPAALVVTPQSALPTSAKTHRVVMICPSQARLLSTAA